MRAYKRGCIYPALISFNHDLTLRFVIKRASRKELYRNPARVLIAPLVRIPYKSSRFVDAGKYKFIFLSRVRKRERDDERERFYARNIVKYARANILIIVEFYRDKF